jgi:hypothetical protein
MRAWGLMIRGVTDTNRKGSQVIDNSSAMVTLGLEGMAVLAVSDGDGELEYAIETTQGTGWSRCVGRRRASVIDARHGCGIYPLEAGR